MRISAKSRYALAAVVTLAKNYGASGNVTVIYIAESLGISKIYLEQVFAQLKRAGIVLSSKGSQGGYQLKRSPARLTAWDVLSQLEPALTEPAESTVNDNAPDVEAAMHALLFRPLDRAVSEFLSRVSIQDLLDYAEGQKAEGSFMLNM